MRAGDSSLQAEPMRVISQRFDMARHRIVGFVAMHVHPQALFGGEFAQQSHRLRAIGHGALEMRDATDHVDPHRHGALQVVERRRTAQQAVLGEGHQLQVEVGCNLLLHLQQSLHRQQTVIADIDMGTDRQQTASNGPVAILQRARHQRFLRQQRLEFAPKGDAFKQGAGTIDARQAVTERGIHMKVRIDEGRRYQVAAGIDFLCTAHCQRRADCNDAARRHRDIDMTRAVGQGSVANDQIHGRFFLCFSRVDTVADARRNPCRTAHSVHALRSGIDGKCAW